MKINNIKKLSQQYIIELTNGTKIKTYAEIILKYKILYKKEITNETLNKIDKENIYYDAYHNTIKYITKKLRSEYEIKNYLNKYLLNQNEKKEIIIKLKQLNLINDKKFTKAYINDQLSFTMNGPYKIKKELENFKIEENIINEIIENIDTTIYYKKIKKIIEKKLKTKQKYSGNILKQKLVYELKQLGYPNEIVYETLNNINLKGNIEIEYNKIYNKLKNKYNKLELNKIIKQKLYSLGYTYEDIEKITQN